MCTVCMSLDRCSKQTACWFAGARSAFGPGADGRDLGAEVAEADIGFRHSAGPDQGAMSPCVEFTAELGATMTVNDMGGGPATGRRVAF